MSTENSSKERKTKSLIQNDVKCSLDYERKIIKRAKEIEKELLSDGQTFCKASYLMGALDYKNGEFLL